MSRTALVEALKRFDVEAVRTVLNRSPHLRDLRLGDGLDLLQYCSSRTTAGDPAAAERQLRLARWLVDAGFDPRVIYTSAPGADGEEQPATLSLVWFAVAKARNDRLARYFLAQGASPGALFAAAWWANAGIVPDLVRHGARLDEVVGATPLQMAVEVLRRGVDGDPGLARRRRELLERMLALGADPNVAALDGTTPLRVALDRGYHDAFALLVAHGADPDLPGKDGRTVREIAARKRDRRYFEALRSS